MLRSLRNRLSAPTPTGRPNRRQFLGLAGVGALGLGTGIAGRTTGQLETSTGDGAEIRLGDHGHGVRRLVWSVDTDHARIALTFDDGPDPRFTPRVLDILDRYGVSATFMPMGYNATEHRALMEEVVSAGHEIGSHTWSHRSFVDLTPEETRDEIVRGSAAIADITGAEPTLFRPPKGRMTEAGFAHAGDLGYDVVLWSVTRGDLDVRDPDVVADHVTSTIGPGDIVLLHDGIGRGTFNPGHPMEDELFGRRETEVRALPRILEGISAAGLEPCTVQTLLDSEGAV